MIDLITYATTETRWARAMRRVLLLIEPTPIYDQLVAERQVEKTPLSSRRHTDAGTPPTVTRQPGNAAASARSSSSTRPTRAAAGQGPRR